MTCHACCHRPLQLALAVFFPLPTRHLLMFTYAHEHILQLTLGGGGGGGGGGCMWW